MTNYLCNIRFKVIYETTFPNQSLKVVGNIKELGNWDIDKAIPLYKSQVEKNVWTSKEIQINKKSFLPNQTQSYYNKKILFLESSKGDSTNNSLTNMKRSILNTPLSSEKSKIELDIIYEDEEAETENMILKKLEYKYTIFKTENNVTTFSHWESLSKNENHTVNIQELQYSHILLINQKFKIFTCVESGLKFKFSLPEESNTEYTDNHYSYNLENFHNFILRYISLYIKNEKNDIVQISKKIDEIMSNMPESKKEKLDSNNNNKNYLTLTTENKNKNLLTITSVKNNEEDDKHFLKAKSSQNVKNENQKLYVSPPSNCFNSPGINNNNINLNDYEVNLKSFNVRENQTLLEKMLAYSKTELKDITTTNSKIENEKIEFEKSYLLQNLNPDEKIHFLKEKLSKIKTETKIILTSVFLPCKVFIDSSSLKNFNSNCERRESTENIRFSNKIITNLNSFNKKKNEVILKTKNSDDTKIQTDENNSTNEDNNRKSSANPKADIYQIKFGISFFEDSFTNNFTNILQRSLFGYKKFISFNWIGYLINYYDILDQLGIKYPKSNTSESSSLNSFNGELEKSYDEEEIQIINSKLEDLLRKHNMTFIKIEYDVYQNFKKAVSDYLEPLMNFIKYFYDLERILNYDKCWEALKIFNYTIAETVNSISSGRKGSFENKKIEEENTLVIVQDMPLCLLPSYLQNFYKKFKISFWLFNNFPSADSFRSFPNRTEILKSILKSNLVGFNTYSSSRNFITAVKKILNLNYCSNQDGQLLFNMSGREIYVDVQSITTDKENIYDIVCSREFEKVNTKIKNLLEGKKYVFLSIDPWLYLTGARHKMMAFKLFLEKIKDKNLHSKIKYIQLFHTSETYITNQRENELVQMNYESTEKMGNEINQEFGINIIKIKKKNEISLIEKLAYFLNCNCYIKLARREPFNTDVYDYLLTKEILFENLDMSEGETTKNKGGTNKLVNQIIRKEYKVFDQLKMQKSVLKHNNKAFCIMLSETNEACTSLNSSLKANQFDTMTIYNNFLEVYERITNPNEEILSQIVNDIRITEKNSITNWLMNLIYKLITIDDKGKSMIKKGYGLNMSLIRNVSNFTPLNEENLIVNYNNSFRRILIFDAETCFISKRNEITKMNLNYTGFEDDNEDLPQYFFEPYSKLIHKLKDLSNDSKNILIIISSRTKREMDFWFRDLENVILVAEMGFFVNLRYNFERNIDVNTKGIKKDSKSFFNKNNLNSFNYFANDDLLEKAKQQSHIRKNSNKVKRKVLKINKVFEKVTSVDINNIVDKQDSWVDKEKKLENYFEGESFTGNLVKEEENNELEGLKHLKKEEIHFLRTTINYDNNSKSRSCSDYKSSYSFNIKNIKTLKEKFDINVNKRNDYNDELSLNSENESLANEEFEIDEDDNYYEDNLEKETEDRKLSYPFCQLKSHYKQKSFNSMSSQEYDKNQDNIQNNLKTSNTYLKIMTNNNIKEINNSVLRISPNDNDDWIEFIENTQLSWIDEVMFQLKPYVYKCEGTYLVQNETHIIWNYQNADTVQAYSFIKAIYNEFEAPLKQINVVIENISNCLYFKLNIISKENFINFFLFNLVESNYEPNVIFAMGGDDTFEKTYKNLKVFEKLNPNSNVFSCNIGEKVSSAKYYLNSKKEAYQIIKNISKLSIPELKSNLGKTLFNDYNLYNKKELTNPKRHKSCKQRYYLKY